MAKHHKGEEAKRRQSSKYFCCCKAPRRFSISSFCVVMTPMYFCVSISTISLLRQREDNFIASGNSNSKALTAVLARFRRHCLLWGCQGLGKREAARHSRRHQRRGRLGGRGGKELTQSQCAKALLRYHGALLLHGGLKQPSRGTVRAEPWVART